MLGFIGFCVGLLAKAPKASTAFVFKEVVNQTGRVLPTSLQSSFRFER